MSSDPDERMKELLAEEQEALELLADLLNESSQEEEE